MDEIQQLRDEVVALRKEVERLRGSVYGNYPVAAPAGPNFPYPVQPLPMPPYPFHPYYVPNTAQPAWKPNWEFTCAAQAYNGDGGTGC